MDGITYPLLWKASPNKSQIALISKYHPGERNLKQAYLDSAISSTYSPPPISEFCLLAVKIVQILEQIHEKQVRHGNLRPEIISFWFKYSEIFVCIRDFTESALLGESGTPASDDPSSQIGDSSVPISHCIHYLAPEALGGTKLLCNTHSNLLIASGLPCRLLFPRCNILSSSQRNTVVRGVCPRRCDYNGKCPRNFCRAPCTGPVSTYSWQTCPVRSIGPAAPGEGS